MLAATILKLIIMKELRWKQDVSNKRWVANVRFTIVEENYNATTQFVVYDSEKRVGWYLEFHTLSEAKTYCIKKIQ